MAEDTPHRLLLTTVLYSLLVLAALALLCYLTCRLAPWGLPLGGPLTF